MSNFNAIRGKSKHTVEIGGKVRSIKFDLNAYGELEDLYGSVEKAMAKLQTGSIKAVRAVLWAGLIHEEAVLDPTTGEPTKYNITPYQVGSWIAPDQLATVMKSLQKAMVDDLPEELKQEAGAELSDIEKKAMLRHAQDVGGSLGEVATVILTEEEKQEEEKKG